MEIPSPPRTKVPSSLGQSLMVAAPVTTTVRDAPTKKRRSSTIKLQPRVHVSEISRAHFLPQRLSGIHRILREKQDFESRADNQCLNKIVLKMTMQTEEDLITSFVINQDSAGCGIGRQSSNFVCIPADKYMLDINHAMISNLIDPIQGAGFYITNGNDGENDTYIRLYPVSPQDSDTKTQWPLFIGCQFRAGKSDFKVVDITATTLCLHLLSGKLAGSAYDINVSGATIGRSADNTIHMGDGELSRKHAAIWNDGGNFYLIDVGSTNGTFMKLCGTYGHPFRLEIGDHLLISQTCLAVNRFDYGINDDMGYRKHMEDSHLLVQDLNISSLAKYGMSPQSFFGVFDGHGGHEASQYLHFNLHKHIISQVESRTNSVEFVDDSELDSIITQSLEAAFKQTDEAFLRESDRPQAGSTATTVLIAGSRMYVANVGDSRTVLSRQGKAVRLSNDHKPSRPDEAQRIRATGGFIIHGRIMGELAVSRAFGDCEFKTYDTYGTPSTLQLEDDFGNEKPAVNPNEILKGPLVIATPEITLTQLTDDEDFIVMGSDGLFDVFEDQAAVDFIKDHLCKCGDIQRAVEALVESAIGTQGSRDNVTAIVILFKDITSM